MKLYKAFLKEEQTKRVNATSPIVITEPELDHLIDGESIEKIDSTGKPYTLYYSDLKMVISHDYKIE